VLNDPFCSALRNFLAGLTVDAKCRYRPCLKPFDADLLTALLADPIFTVVQPLQRFLDFEDELALTVAYTQDRISIGFHGSSICRVWKISVFIHGFDSLARLQTQLTDSMVQKITKVFEIFLVQRAPNSRAQMNGVYYRGKLTNINRHIVRQCAASCSPITRRRRRDADAPKQKPRCSSATWNGLMSVGSAECF